MMSSLGALLRANETRVVFALLGAIALVDVGLRLAEQRLSGNLAHIAAIPELIVSAGRPERHALLVLGNSLTHNGVAAPVISGALPDFSVAKVTPDGTNLWDWQCVLDHQVVDRREVQFDTVVVGFAWHLLSDQTPADASRLGALYCNFGDLTHPQAIGLRNSADIGEFVAARVLRTYALRDTLRNRFFQVSIPNYVQFTQAGNAARAGITDKPAARRAVKTQHTFETLAGVADRLKSKGTRLIVVAMPVQTPYDIDTQLRALAESGTLDLIDLREIAELDVSHYLDGIHLNPAGQKILSRTLARDLHDMLASAT